VINKTDLAQAIGADLGVMQRDALRMRDGGPFVFAQVSLGHYLVFLSCNLCGFEYPARLRFSAVRESTQSRSQHVSRAVPTKMEARLSNKNRPLIKIKIQIF